MECARLGHHLYTHIYCPSDAHRWVINEFEYHFVLFPLNCQQNNLTFYSDRKSFFRRLFGVEFSFALRSSIVRSFCSYFFYLDIHRKWFWAQSKKIYRFSFCVFFAFWKWSGNAEILATKELLQRNDSILVNIDTVRYPLMRINGLCSNQTNACWGRFESDFFVIPIIFIMFNFPLIFVYLIFHRTHWIDPSVYCHRKLMSINTSKEVTIYSFHFFNAFSFDSNGFFIQNSPIHKYSTQL